jgi:hypothetical protein
MINLFKDVQTIVNSGKDGIYTMSDKLNAMGHKDAKYISASGVRYVKVTYKGTPHYVISKNAVEIDEDTQIIGAYAVGVI